MQEQRRNADIMSTPPPATDAQQQDMRICGDTSTGRKKRTSTSTSTQATNRYHAKVYDRMELQLIKGDKERLKAAAAALDISPTALIIRAVNAYTSAETLTEKAKNLYI